MLPGFFSHLFSPSASHLYEHIRLIRSGEEREIPSCLQMRQSRLRVTPLGLGSGLIGECGGVQGLEQGDWQVAESVHLHPAAGAAQREARGQLRLTQLGELRREWRGGEVRCQMETDLGGGEAWTPTDGSEILAVCLKCELFYIFLCQHI